MEPNVHIDRHADECGPCPHSSWRYVWCEKCQRYVDQDF